MSGLLVYLILLVLIFVLDMIWIGLIAKKFYVTELSPIARWSGGSMSPDWPSAILVYLIFSLGIVTMALPLADDNIFAALAYGGLFGFITYGVHDLTNYSTLNSFSLKMALVDMGWGVFLGAAAGLTGGILYSL
ncbi:MAG: DUF2177 family protein [Dehalococcoides mccartyi]|jgi:Predicted membrane protein|uniref:DUF2177 domain-containing protein n=2 Tax=root TaxID=1 RepID=A0A0V8LYT0_9CHLR|nr:MULTISPECIES: DUF2177 family protein [Dehalococcoides]AII59392.1 hypothetical protein X793_03290 [Dehalococcoides mccartyi CG4]AQU03096.1 hypothetical protein B1773_03310 [Dehalococcoides mccartyi]AQU04412.1 hypothetical protein B1774_03060 [Dehalococcoides mccartyi]KSV16433.1 hypothetical protein DA01_04170 [Dehalococcoides mccartyi]MBF4482872.1 DUF2177 family protein [Dehalococcoides mccartyi]